MPAPVIIVPSHFSTSICAPDVSNAFRKASCPFKGPVTPFLGVCGLVRLTCRVRRGDERFSPPSCEASRHTSSICCSRTSQSGSCATVLLLNKKKTPKKNKNTKNNKHNKKNTTMTYFY